jgi:hypothetical protein
LASQGYDVDRDHVYRLVLPDVVRDFSGIAAPKLRKMVRDANKVSLHD